MNVTGAESSTPAAPTTADATPTAAGEAPGHNANAPFPPEDSYISFIPQEGKEGQEFYKYERLILQMIVRYGEKVMCNVTNEEGQEIPVSVIEYVVSDLKARRVAIPQPAAPPNTDRSRRAYPRRRILQPNVIFWLIRTLPSAN